MISWPRLILGLCLLIPSLTWASHHRVLNVYTWADEIPYEVIKQFEQETGIKVNYATYDSNEVMFAKLLANKNSGYDIIEPSNSYIGRMQQLGMLEKLDKSQLSNFKNLDPFFLNPPYDPQSEYSLPFIWGITGLVINTDYINPKEVQSWDDLFNKKFANQLLILDEAREAFSMALKMSGFSVNDRNPQHIHAAFLKLHDLMPNIRLFNSDAVISILIDEDATIGMAWNGDYYKASLENPKLQFIFPRDGFEIWVDSFALLKNAPHRAEAYQFLNFLMRPDIAANVSLSIGYATANATAKRNLPAEIKNNTVLYPSLATLQRGEFTLDSGEQATTLFERYWELLKMGG